MADMRQIAATDKQIDAMVHELYGLTAYGPGSGIRVVEGAVDSSRPTADGLA